MGSRSIKVTRVGRTLAWLTITVWASFLLPERALSQCGAGPVDLTEQYFDWIHIPEPSIGPPIIGENISISVFNPQAPGAPGTSLEYRIDVANHTEKEVPGNPHCFIEPGDECLAEVDDPLIGENVCTECFGDTIGGGEIGYVRWMLPFLIMSPPPPPPLLPIYRITVMLKYTGPASPPEDLPGVVQISYVDGNGRRHYQRLSRRDCY